MQTKLLILFIVSLITISGCGSISQPIPSNVFTPLTNTVSNPSIASQTNQVDSPTNQAGSPTGYLINDNSNVIFIRWTEVDKNLSGQMQIFQIQNENGNQQGNSSTHSVSGVLDKGNISLNFTGSVWLDGLGGQVWTGTLKGKILTLVIPNSDGKLNTVLLQSATVEDYNNAITNLQNNMADTNKLIKNQKIEQALAQAEADKIAIQQNEVAISNQNLSKNINYIPNIIKQNNDTTSGFDEILISYATHYADLQDKYAQIKTDASVSPLTDSMIGSIESQLGSMESTLGSIESDGGSMESRQGSVDTYISELNDLKLSIEKNWTYLQNAVTANMTGSPKAQFTSDDTKNAINSVTSEIERVNSLSQEKHKQSDKIYANAKILLSEASKFVNGLKATNQGTEAF
jgi:hypothetical protein